MTHGDRQTPFAEAMAIVGERQKIEAIRQAIGDHGCPEHLLGLLGKLYSYAMDLAPHNRDRDYGPIMDIMNEIFEKLDPVNKILYPDQTPARPRRANDDNPQPRRRRRPRRPKPETKPQVHRP